MSAGSPLIGIVDYGMGNRRSVEKAFEHVGARIALTGDHDTLRAADALVLPGVGAFRAAMDRLNERGLADLVVERAGVGTPLLGLCLGMQLLFDHSSELGGADGLGLLAGGVRELRADGLKLPHIGWSPVRWVAETPLAEDLPDPTAFYHVHSFVAEPEDPSVVVGVATYGEDIPSVVSSGDVHGAQFHPEKSSTHGLGLLRNFTRLAARVAS